MGGAAIYIYIICIILKSDDLQVSKRYTAAALILLEPRSDGHDMVTFTMHYMNPEGHADWETPNRTPIQRFCMR